MAKVSWDLAFDSYIYICDIGKRESGILKIDFSGSWISGIFAATNRSLEQKGKEMQNSIE